MKIYLLAAFGALCSLSIAQQPYSLKVKVANFNGDKVYLYQDNGNDVKKIDSTTVKDGSLTFAGTLSEPALFFLAPAKQNPFLALFMEKGNIEANVDVVNPQTNTVKGSVPNDEFVQFLKESQNGNNLEGAANFVQKNPNSIVSVYMLQRLLLSQMEFADSKKLAAQISPSLSKTTYYRELTKKLDEMGRLEVGKVAPAFVMKDINGRDVSLESFRGKCLIIDFWASWCGPCRGESPNMVKLYEDFKAKGLEILGVSLDKDKTAWQKAIDSDKLVWTHISDLQYWNNAVAKLYRVNSIPQTYLLDKNGVIIGKNLRGESLREAVAKALNQ
ncbi:MAG: TlpA disulfide reductase family protein [Bacteroidota bacterium]|nr:TlpA disulfide reductase family protein [Bacteroidota bacterium]